MTTTTHGTLIQAARVLLALGMLGATGTPALAAARGCEDHRLAVALAPGLPPDQQVFARLCVPEGAPAASVQLLLHGNTYTQLHWDFPDPTGGSARYSYVSAALDAGFATLALDRIGSGESSRPLGLLVTAETNAYVVHQVVQALRAGRLSASGAPGFQKVVLVGHSYGSITAWYEASDYQDVDAVILSGVSHFYRPTAPLQTTLFLGPAALDPAFFGKGYDLTYLTTRPGSREASFYLPGAVDPAVLALDERTKSTLTAGEALPLVATLLRPLDIRVPVLLATGDQDGLFCGLTPEGSLCQDARTLRTWEAPRLGAHVPCADAFVLPDAGHILNTIQSAPVWFAVAQDWATRRVGPGPGPAPGCTP